MNWLIPCLLALSWAAPAAAQSIIDRRDIHVIAGTAPDLPFTDIAPLLDASVGDAKIVGIGEAVHGASALLEMQHRIVRYLVEHRHFRLIVVEGGVLRTEPASAWLEACAENASPADVPLDTSPLPYAESIATLQYLCVFNRNHPHDRVRIVGMDVADRPWEHQARIARLAPVLAPGAHTDALIQSALQSCALHQDLDWTALALLQQTPLEARVRRPIASYQACLAALNQLLAQTRRRLPHVSGAERHEAYQLLRALQTARGWQRFQAYTFYGLGDRVEHFNVRDEAMADNVLASWHEFNSPRTIVLAHALHTTLLHSAADWGGLGPQFQSCFYHIRRAPDVRRVRSIAIIGYDLNGLQGAYTEATAPDSLDLQLHNAGAQFAFVRAHGRLSAGGAQYWFQSDNSPERPNGLRAQPDSQFDAFFFIDQSAAARLLAPISNPWLW